MADNYCKCCGDGTPEYIIELNQQGAPGKRGEKGEQGYSPVVDFIADDNEIKFTSTNENNITSTPNLYDFLMKRDGTNTLNPAYINGTKFESMYSGMNTYITATGTTLISGGGSLTLKGKPDSDYADLNLGTTIRYNGREIATLEDISDSKITIKQGNDIKGSFTLNQESDAIITLDSGIVNPLEFYSDDKTRKFQIKYDSNNSLTINNYTLNSYGSTELGVQLMPIYAVGNPLLATKETSWTYAKGLYSLTLQYDNDTLKVNGDNKLYADFTPINNSITTIEGNITELTTLADTTEATLNELKTDYETNKTEVAEELTTLGNQINTKVSKTELDELADTKNDNIFDIGKFTVVGSPTITDEGVASGFNSSNYIRIPFPSSVTNFTAELNFKFNDTSIASYSGYCIHASNSPFMIYINASNGKYGNINTVFTNSDISTQYNFGTISGSSYFLTERVYFEYRLLNNILSCRARFGETGDWINFPKTYTIADVILTKTYSLLTNNSSAFNCDLKNFSITVDGKEVFNGLMSSTKPIYDKITTTNTTLSTFQTDTTNNFSAVNSALNEKANISDLANYVPLATYNALLARVEALEAEINGGNA